MAFAALLVAMLMGLIFRSRYRKQRAIVKQKIGVQGELLGGVVDVFDGYRTSVSPVPRPRLPASW